MVLCHPGLGCDGLVRMVFQVSDFQDLQSHYRVDVFIGGKAKDELGDTRSEGLAAVLGWFLSSVFM